MIINKDSIIHWTMIWEEEGHRIFINIENMYKYTFSSTWAPQKTLIWFCYFSSPRNSSSKLCNTRGLLLGQRCGKRELQLLQHNDAKIQVPSHGPPYLYLYALWRVRRHTQVAETTIAYMRRYTRVSMQKVTYLWRTWLLYIATCVRTWVSLRKVMYTSKTHF